MKTFATLALAGLAVAAPHNHAAFHEKKDVLENLAADFTNMLSAGQNLLTQLNVQPAVNSQTATADSWLGSATSGNAVVNTIVNRSGKDATWVCWGKAASWLSATAARVSVKVPHGQNATVSHAISEDQWNPNTGGCSAMFEGDGLDHSGQPNQAWMEFSFLSNEYVSSTFDLSMEVNPNGYKNMTIFNDQCKSDYNTCSFHCKDSSLPYCGEANSYELIGCAPGSQPGAVTGTFGGQASGGCQGISNTGISHLTTILN